MIRVGDRAPKFLRIRIQSGTSGVDLSTCDEIRIRLVRESGSLVREVSLTSIVKTPAEASGVLLFAADGSDWPASEVYSLRVFALAAGAWLLDYETTIGAEPTRAGWLGT